MWSEKDKQNDAVVFHLGYTLGLLSESLKRLKGWDTIHEEAFQKAENALNLVTASLNSSPWRIREFPEHCPFCGHSPKIEMAYSNPNWRLVVFCEYLECRIRNVGMDLHEWNKRPTRIVPGA